MLSNPRLNAPASHPLISDRHPLAGFLCLAGFFLYLVLSSPLLDAVGFHYSSETGAPYEKVHPGTYFIFLAALVLFARHTLTIAYDAYRNHLPYVALFLFYIIIFAYMVTREGMAGLAFMIDGHIALPIGAIVLCYIPRSYCLKAIYFFAIFAFFNSAIGILESLGRFRIFTFTEDTNFLNEAYFRASSFIGHPLANAAFTAIALFITLALPLRTALKYLLTAVHIAGLVAFGGRSALIFTILWLMIYGLVTLVKTFYSRGLSLIQIITLASMAISAPFILLGGVYLLVNSSIGERIAVYSDLKDDSANTRMLAFQSVEYMDGVELFFGVSTARIEEITDHMNQRVNLGHIENPWVLMLMHFGALGFALWLLVTAAFLYHLTKREKLELKIAVLIYFFIATTFNSFAVKNVIYPIMVFAVICASRTLNVSKYPFANGNKENTF